MNSPTNASHVKEIKFEELVSLCNKQKFDQALDILNLIKPEDFNHVSLFLLKGLSLSGSGCLDEAVDVLMQGLERFPDTNSLHLLIGKLCVSNNSHTLEVKARKHLGLFLLGDPKNLDVLELYATSCDNIGSVDDAIKARQEIFSINSGELNNCMKLARLKFSSDLIDDALSLYRYVESKSNSSEVKEELKKVEEIVKQKKKNKIKVARYPKKVSDIEGNIYKAINKYVVPGNDKAGRFIAHQSRFFTAGSCFARHVASSLEELGYNVHRLALDESVNTTFSNKYLFRWLSGSDIPQTIQTRFQALCDNIGVNKKDTQQQLVDATAIILTVGVAPCFFNRETGEVVLPSPGDINFQNLSNKYVFRNTSVEENKNNILDIVSSVRRLNKKAKIFFTLSPVPLNTSFELESAVVADCLSKSTLRVAVDEALSTKPASVYYWPSFEIVRWLYPHIGSPFGGDDGSNFHVNQDIVRDVIKSFVETHKLA